MIGFRADSELRAAIEKWAKAQADKPKLSDAIRQLVEIGLTVRARPRQLSQVRAEKAKAMAANQLDQLADKSASAEEQASRKQRLLKGPEEFREVRVDRSKTKGK